MNIAAYRAACEVCDLDPRAKHALQTICAHVPRPPTTTVKLRIDQLAIDMGVSYTTAYRALRRLKASGYVAVMYGPSKSLIVTLSAERLGGRIGADAYSGLGAHAYSEWAPTPKRIGAHAYSDLGVIGEKQESVRAASPNGPAHAQGNGAVSAQTAPTHPDDCACAGTGWIEHPAGVVRCPARTAGHRA